jgi:hypothetical protein
MWYSGTVTKTEGKLIAIFDAVLPNNEFWSIFDASAGTNCKVYRQYNPEENSEFYVKVDDNYADYAQIELWEDWDEVSHAGVGVSMTYINNASYYMRINKNNGGWGMSLLDNRFVYVDRAEFIGTYIGQLRRFDLTKNMPVYIGELTGIQSINPLGYFSSASNAGWSALFDEARSTRVISPYAYGSNYMFPRTITGQFIAFECCVFNNTTLLIMGQLEGVTNHGQGPTGQINNGEVITLSGVDWLVIGGIYSGKYWSFVRMS